MNKTFEVLNAKRFPRLDNVVGDYSKDATIIKVEHGEYFQPGMIFEVKRTGDCCYVREVLPDNKLSVTRGYKYEWIRNIPAPLETYPIENGDELLIMASAISEETG